MEKSFSNKAVRIFREAIQAFKAVERNTHSIMQNPYEEKTIEYQLYKKNWIDNIQWALEDIIRDPDIEPVNALAIKRWIDRSNQERTDTVEEIDAYFRRKYQEVQPQANATINTESPAWAIDRLSILTLKIAYMQEAVQNPNNNEAVISKSKNKLAILEQQLIDLTVAIDQLLEDISSGSKYMKVYHQMKMYNDPELNPMLKGHKL